MIAVEIKLKCSLCCPENEISFRERERDVSAVMNKDLNTEVWLVVLKLLSAADWTSFHDKHQMEKSVESQSQVEDDFIIKWSFTHNYPEKSKTLIVLS